MVALATLLSVVPFFRLFNGGSVTLCSMLPIVLIAYKHGWKWGLLTGFTDGLLQLLLGASDLKGLSMGAVFGSILLDFVLAFTVLGLAGVFRKKIKAPALSIGVGTLLVTLLRFGFHILSGYLVFGGFATYFFEQFQFGAYFIQNVSGSAYVWMYTLIYNGLYMIPEIIITTLVAVLLLCIPAVKKLVSSPKT